MLLRCVVLLILAVMVSPEPTEKREVKTGKVPIFDGRVTNEPITFTFTTALPSPAPTTFPAQLDGVRILPTLRPLDHKESLVQTNYHAFNEKWQYSPPQTTKPSRTFPTPMYNQAQYYRAMQAGLISNQPYEGDSPYKTAWAQIGDSWHQMKSTLVASGIEKDWRKLWGKFTGAVEPFMSEFGEQLGRMTNIFLRQQRLRLEKELERPNNPFRLFGEDRSQRKFTNILPLMQKDSNSING